MVPARCRNDSTGTKSEYSTGTKLEYSTGTIPYRNDSTGTIPACWLRFDTGTTVPNNGTGTGVVTGLMEYQPHPGFVSFIHPNGKNKFCIAGQNQAWKLTISPPKSRQPGTSPSTSSARNRACLGPSPSSLRRTLTLYAPW